LAWAATVGGGGGGGAVPSDLGFGCGVEVLVVLNLFEMRFCRFIGGNFRRAIRLPGLIAYAIIFGLGLFVMVRGREVVLEIFVIYEIRHTPGFGYFRYNRA
jgi:hypothetical protein